jgi:hypothetical protein
MQKVKDILFRFSEALLAFTLFLAVIVGWRLSRLEVIDAREGLGYILGIIGLSMMTIILIYPIKKRYPNSNWLGSTRFWFRLHMLFGVLGPILLLYHANYRVDALNTVVVLFAMILVTLSGIIGRYLYRSVHKGFYGNRIEFADLKRDLDKQEEVFLPLIARFPDWSAQIDTIAKTALLRPIAMRMVWQKWLEVSKQTVQMRALVRKAVRDGVTDTDTARMVDEFLDSAVKTVRFTLLERLFGLWHILHVPLLFIMFITAIIHVIAVHMY